MIKKQLFSRNGHVWSVIGRDKNKRDEVIDTNQYLIEKNGKGLLLDPGGIENFSTTAAELSKHFDLRNLDSLFASHQDPDVISSLTLWVQAMPHIKVHMPSVWVGFITHFGVLEENINAIPDKGGIVMLEDLPLQALPAHYMHSSGNLSLYDAEAKILFSGDIGAALLPEDNDDLFVKDFQEHIGYMEYFHRRWMPSNEAKSRLVSMVRKLDIDMIAPQHGSIFQGEDVARFLNWLDALRVGNGWDEWESAELEKAEAEKTNEMVMAL